MKTHPDDELEQTNTSYWQILTAARQLFAEHGFRETSVRMIAQSAHVNVASINYYFRSKAALYEAIFREAFEQLGKPTAGLAVGVQDAQSWATALRAWLHFMLTLFLDEDPKYSLVRQLVARERSMPTQFCDELFAEFFKPIVDALRELLRMAVPDETEIQLQCILVSCLGQCTCFMHREPPWDQVVTGRDVSREHWIALVEQQVFENITARLQFQRNTFFEERGNG